MAKIGRDPLTEMIIRIKNCFRKERITVNIKTSSIGTSPTPDKSDIFFGFGVKSQFDACVATIDNSMAYQDGYRHAALCLAERFCNTGQGQDSLAYPIVYLYRHHIELVLKSIINVAYFLTDYVPTKEDLDIIGKHDLARLWNLAKPFLDKICALGGWPALPIDDVEGIDSYIRQLHSLDPNGQRFRYSTRKASGQKVNHAGSLPSDLTHINIRDFSNALEKLADYLEGIDNDFGDLVEAKIFSKHTRGKS